MTSWKIKILTLGLTHFASLCSAYLRCIFNTPVSETFENGFFSVWSCRINSHTYQGGLGVEKKQEASKRQGNAALQQPERGAACSRWTICTSCITTFFLPGPAGRGCRSQAEAEGAPCAKGAPGGTAEVLVWAPSVWAVAGTLHRHHLRASVLLKLLWSWGYFLSLCDWD